MGDRAGPVHTLRCPICERDTLEPFFELEALPVHCNVLLPDLGAALAAPTADLRLALCSSCSAIYNTAFDETRVAYAPGYENSLHYSPAFREYAEELAAGLIERSGLNRSRIVEIGCGGGDFLKRICELSDSAGLGFDPGQTRADDEEFADGRVRIVRRPLEELGEPLAADLVICRHVLEHLARPLELLRRLRSELDASPGARVYFEVPEVRYTLERGGIWDLIYEHCSYFSGPALQESFIRAGFEVLELRNGFGGQYLSIEARPAEESSKMAPISPANIPGERRALSRACGTFARDSQRKLDRWAGEFDRARESSKRLAVWGAGSKGVTFLNALGASREVVPWIVDLNPHKLGRFVPGSGQEVISPQRLVEDPPHVVIVVNPVYRAEIAAQLDALGLTANIEVA